MSRSPDGRYVYLSDYGGEDASGVPLAPSYVHRLDLTTGLWQTKQANIAANIEAVAADRIVLSTRSQWIDLSIADWREDSIQLLEVTEDHSVWTGDIEYDARTSRLLYVSHGNPLRFLAFKLRDDQLVAQEEGLPLYVPGGERAVLATDGSTFYNGTLARDALDLGRNLPSLPEVIHAATGRTAFGTDNYYDAQTGALLGSLGIFTTVYALNPAGEDFWAYAPGPGELQHWVPRCK
jgi:hypothetical protein